MKSNPMKPDDRGCDIYGTHISQHLDSKQQCASEAERVRNRVSGRDLTDVNGRSIKEIARETAVCISTARGGLTEVFTFQDQSTLVCNENLFGGYVIDIDKVEDNAEEKIQRLRKYERAIINHNNALKQECDTKRQRKRCEAYTIRGMKCPDCPLEYQLNIK